MSSQSTILKSFPKEFAPRPLQEELIEEIQGKIDSGVRVVLLSAPTGIGKSLIAASIAGYFGSSFVVTASKHLQDQLADRRVRDTSNGKSLIQLAGFHV